MMRILRIFCVACALFLVWRVDSSFGLEHELAGAFQRANVYYEQGKYDLALQEYGAILARGVESGNLYYNIGNCYFKKGEVGRSLLNYEKARRLIPLDKDLEANYEYARSLIKSAGSASGRSLSRKAIDGLSLGFSIDGLTIAVSAFFMLALAGILAGLFFEAVRKRALIFAAAAALLCGAGFSGLSGKIALIGKEAVVVTERTDARFEPIEKATTYFTLYEGQKVQVLSSQESWYKVRREDHKSGWVEKCFLEIF
ncbi:MAG: SH3 domain-containing protein [Candidatus Omnitrophota bacterium]